MRIFSKLLLAALLPALVVVGLASALTYLNLQRGFLGYVTSLESARLDPAVRRLAKIYADDGDFLALRGDPRRWGALLSREGMRGAGPSPRPRPPEDRRPPPHPRRSIDPLELPHRVTLYDGDRHPLVGTGEWSQDTIHKPIEVDGVQVATLGVRPAHRIEAQLDVDYLAGQRRALAYITVFACVLAMVVALLFARSLAATIQSLARGTRRLADGDYESRLELRSKDELGALARDFNHLATELKTAERARRRWVADTSHELRTPLTVIRGDIEAMQDGVRALDQDNLASLHEEVTKLHHLVDDLALLASADRGALTYQMVPVDLRALVGASVAQHRLQLESAGLEVELDVGVEGDAPQLTRGDPRRLAQLVDNLLENSRRYTDPPGPVRVHVWAERTGLRMLVEDGAPGVDTDALPKLFERFYRADTSRSRERGGSGLGLSICTRIAEAHGGDLWAEASTLGGLAVHLRLPLYG